MPGCTLELYRSALRLRRSFGLGAGAMRWLSESDDSVVAFENGGVVVVANTGDDPVPLPPGTVLLASADLPGDGTLPPDATAWVS